MATVGAIIGALHEYMKVSALRFNKEYFGELGVWSHKLPGIMREIHWQLQVILPQVDGINLP